MIAIILDKRYIEKVSNPSGQLVYGGFAYDCGVHDDNVEYFIEDDMYGGNPSAVALYKTILSADQKIKRRTFSIIRTEQHWLQVGGVVKKYSNGQEYIDICGRDYIIVGAKEFLYNNSWFRYVLRNKNGTYKVYNQLDYARGVERFLLRQEDNVNMTLVTRIFAIER